MKYGVVLLCALLAAGVRAEDNEGTGKDGEPINVAVVTGGHGFDEPAFLALFASLENVHHTHLPQKKGSEFLEDIADWPYDVVVLYNMSRGISEKRRANFEALLDRGVGLVVLHHAIANYPEWPGYAAIIGGSYFFEETTRDSVTYPRSEYTHDAEIRVKIEDAGHPVTRGVEDFTIVDETYRKWVYDAGNHLLLSTDHAESNRELAWTREAAGRRVCVIQPGHGPEVFSDAAYRRLVAQAIRWVARRESKE
ncbi:MAG TPA: ThuA domain-containing protein [Candidatus Hydrogenedentes bacterium]|nr:ThuA domain-containing protein [Candidatus Hydrogenedentota bacterium]